MSNYKYNGYTITHTYNNGNLDITIHNPEDATDTDLMNTAYWFAYSNLGTGTTPRANGLTRDGDTATAHYIA